MEKRLTPLIVSIMSLVVFSSATFANTPNDVLIPANLQFASHEKEMLRVDAKGVQIYECKADAQDATKFEWSFKSPEAELVDANGNGFGKHYGGPTWESNDGSKVIGEVKARADSPDTDAIPWLLLTAKFTSGAGVFSETKSIQRVNTRGGKAPKQCSVANTGNLLRVPYSATYVYSTDSSSTK